MQQQCDIGLCGFWIKLKQLKFVDATLDYSQVLFANYIFIIMYFPFGFDSIKLLAFSVR